MRPRGTLVGQVGGDCDRGDDVGREQLAKKNALMICGAATIAIASGNHDSRSAAPLLISSISTGFRDDPAYLGELHGKPFLASERCTRPPATWAQRSLVQIKVPVDVGWVIQILKMRLSLGCQAPHRCGAAEALWPSWI